MNDPLKTLMAGMPISANLFPPNSRYHGVAMAEYRDGDGNRVVHLRRRFLPPASGLAMLNRHTVVAGDRLDNLAHQYFNDAERFWQICDANNAMRPDDLTEVEGRELRITLPEGIPGS